MASQAPRRIERGIPITEIEWEPPKLLHLNDNKHLNRMPYDIQEEMAS